MALPLIAAGIGASVFSGILGNSRARRQARIQGRISGLQNEIYAEQFQQKRDNLLLQRREQFRQQSAATAGARVAAAASGSSRSSSYGVIQNSIRSRTEENVGNINRAISSGERLSGLNQQIAQLGGELNEASVPSSFETLAGTVASPLISYGISQS